MSGGAIVYAARAAGRPGMDAAILSIGPAVAVLVAGVADEPVARTAAAQAALRSCTGRADIVIGRRPSGRPRLAPPYPELAVSLSHRGDLLLAAMSPSADVGVDLEPETAELDPHRLTADHFAPAEAAAIAPLDAGRGRDLFLRLWVAKEAALKVTGRGIYDGLCEPDLAHHLAALEASEAGVVLAPSPRLPALRLAVRRVTLPGRPVTYCALAVADAT